ncbi:MAG: hypothetical protein QM724_13360 [Flavobacteriales bacterium]
MQARLQYELELTRRSEDFVREYDSTCVQVLETLTRAYDAKPEHHFTLYYYDQAGNLVRTVPPAGVSLVPSGNEAALDADRSNGTRSIFTGHVLTSDHVYNSLDQPIYECVPDKDAMALWESHLTSGLPAGLRITGSSFPAGGRGYLSGYMPVAKPSSVSTERGYLFSTNDGGHNWSRLDRLIGSDLKGIVFSSPTVGYAVGPDGMVLRTYDAGQSWDRCAAQSMNCPSLEYNDIAMYDDQYGIVVGNNGFIRRSTSSLNGFAGAQTWTPRSNVGHALTAWANPATSYTAALDPAGKNGMILTGAKGGDDYTPRPFYTSANLNCGAVLSDGSNAFLAGDYGVLLSNADPTNPGSSWRTIATHCTDDVKGIWFMNVDRGLALMDSVVGAIHFRVLRYTANGGVTWLPCGTPEMDLRDLCAINATGDAIVVGAHGQIYRVFMGGGDVPGIARVQGPGAAHELTTCWAGMMDGRLAALVGDAMGLLHWTLDLKAENVQWRTETVFAGAERVRKVVATVTSSTTLNAALLSSSSEYAPGKRAVRKLTTTDATPWVSFSSGSSNDHEALALQPNGDATYFNTASNRIERWALSSATPTMALVVNANTGPTNAMRVVIPVTDLITTVAGASGAIKHAAQSGTTTWTDRVSSISPLPIYGFNKSGGTSDAAGAQGTLYKRSADGFSWQVIPTREVEDLHGFAHIGSPAVSYAVGDHGVLIRGDIKGGTPNVVTRIPLPVDVDLNDLRVSGNDLVAVGDKGLAMHMDLASEAITVLDLQCGNLNRLHQLPSGGDFFAVGDAGEMHRIHGTSHIPVRELFPGRINDVSFSTSANGYAVGANELVLHTRDAGQNWSVLMRAGPLSGPPYGYSCPDAFLAVCCDRPDHGAAVGDNSLARWLGRTDHSSMGVPAVGSGPSKWNDVAIAENGTTVLAGEWTRGKVAIWRPQFGATPPSWTTREINVNPARTGGLSALLKTVWAFPPYQGSQDFLLSGTNGRTFLVKHNLNDNSLLYPSYDATPSNGSELAPLTGLGTIQTCWFHDAKTGLLGTSTGELVRFSFENPTHPKWALYTATNLSTSGAGHPDNLDGQGNMANIGLTTMGFIDRNQGFLGGTYALSSTATTPPKRYARTVFDQLGLYTDRFWYDRLGRPVLSQNAQQFDPDGDPATLYPKQYSYSFYDDLGRIIEAGQVEDPGQVLVTDPPTTPTPQPSLPTIINAFGTDLNGRYAASVIDARTLRNWIEQQPDNARTEVVHTTYDTPLGSAATAFTSGQQDNTLNRVAAVSFQQVYNSDPTVYDHATHFSYDIHGNVKSMVQDFPRLGTDVQFDQRSKRIDYTYDLISGNVKRVDYQSGAADQFHHRYTYDADNRITKVETSIDNIDWHEDAAYFYYPHGPLLRTELGADKVQGLDYAYTLQGWVKGMNSELLTPANDMGNDGVDAPGNPHSDVGRDAFGYSLTYFANDYEAIDGTRWNNTTFNQPFAPKPWTPTNGYRDLHNGNIAATVHSLQPGAGWHVGDAGQALAGVYRYDQLNRLREWKSYSGLTAGANEWGTVDGKYFSSYKYDANGNITNVQRKDQNGTVYDSLHYYYGRLPGGRLRSNRLYDIRDVGDEAAVTRDDDGFDDLPTVSPTFTDNPANPTDENTSNNYRYDHNGNLVRDGREGIGRITWTLAGKVRSVERSGGTRQALDFAYGAGGHRISKGVFNTAGTALAHRDWYVHDAQGNVMAIYRQAPGSFTVRERIIYGSSRVGSFNHVQQLLGGGAAQPLADLDPYLRYELKDHLGNVASVLSGSLLTGHDAPHEADVVSSQGYEPFGSILPGRLFDSGTRQNASVVDEDFESGQLDAWHNQVSAVLSLDNGSTQRLKVEGPVIYDGAQLVFSTIAGGEYEVTLDLDIGTATSVGVAIYSQDPYQLLVNASYATSGTVPFTFTAPGSQCRLKVMKGSNNGVSEAFFIDNVRIAGDAIVANTDGTYRWGFQGQEKDNEVAGTANWYSFSGYGLDVRLGRRPAPDPLTAKYPHISPYAVFNNNPIFFIDSDGRENVPALLWAIKNMANKQIVSNYSDPYFAGSDNRWTYKVGTVPDRTVCYESCFMAYMNSGESVLPTLRTGFTNKNNAFFGRSTTTGGMNWFKSGNGSDRQFVTDIGKGELGDIVFMGEPTDMQGHAVLLASGITMGTTETDGKSFETATFYTLSTSSETDAGSYGGREFTFLKQSDGSWKQQGGAGYTFNGFGQMKNVNATDEQRKEATEGMEEIKKGN